MALMWSESTVFSTANSYTLYTLTSGCWVATYYIIKQDNVYSVTNSSQYVVSVPKKFESLDEAKLYAVKKEIELHLDLLRESERVRDLEQIHLDELSDLVRLQEQTY